MSLIDSEMSELAAELGRRLTARRHVGGDRRVLHRRAVAGAITAIAGSSGWFDRGFVTYSNEAKMEMLGVGSGTLASLGAVSEATAQAMAEGAIRASRAGLAVA